MDKKLNIEELFQKKFDGYEINPSEQAWNALSKTMRRRQFMRFNPSKFNIFYLAGMILAGGTLGALLLVDGPGKTPVNSEPSHAVETSLNDNNISQSSSQENEVISDDVTSRKKELNLREKEIRTTNSSKKEKLNGADPKIQAQSGVSLEASHLANHLVEDEDQSTVSLNLIAYFDLSVNQGCAPLEISITNRSVEANSYSWNFGNDIPGSTEKDPVITFENPGTYTILLTATDVSGNSALYSEDVIVYQAPVADFEITETAIFNHSTNASFFRWEYKGMVSKLISESFVPAFEDLYTFEIPENSVARLQLVASNEFGCRDTAIRIIPDKNQPELLFPNAISPNPGGSTGGYYSLNDLENQVFHPQFTEVPASYLLRIYSKNGEIVFESDEIELGWDGYYKQEPAAQGVYIYQCTGKWVSGQSYNYQGDITVLWKRIQ